MRPPVQPSAPSKAWLHRLPALPWPAPALLVWLLGWTGWGLLRAAGVAPLAALLVPLLVTLTLARVWPHVPAWRRLIVGAGFPASALLGGHVPAVMSWAWLMPLGVLLAAYPLRAWRDAPLFPTPADALHGLGDAVPLPPGARVLDAGCGLGHGLAALQAVWPQARLEGIEWSWPLRLAAALRCPWARVRQGDMWSADWSGCAAVYLFQRPESMARAWAKARAELAPGAWLVSLDFAVPDAMPWRVLHRPGAQPVWIYRVGASKPAAGPRRSIPAGVGR